MGMTTDQRLTLGRERAIEGRSLADLHREAVKIAVDLERERCARIAEEWAMMMVRNEFDQMLEPSDAADQIASKIRKDPAQRA